MLKTDDLDGVKKLIESFKPPVTFFEKEVLIPGMLDRLKYVKEMFTEFQRLAADARVATQIDAAVRTAVNPQNIQTNLPEPQVGQQYLQQVSVTLARDFIGPIDTILNNANTAPPDQNPESLVRFLNSVSQIMHMIVGTKENPFTFSLRSIVNVRNVNTRYVSGKLQFLFRRVAFAATNS